MRKVLGLILLFIALSYAAEIYDGLTLKTVTRNIDLTTQLSTQTSTITVANTGSKATSDFYLAFDSNLADHLSLLEVKDKNGAILKNEKSQNHSNKGRSFVLYRVHLGTSLVAGSSADLSVHSVFSHTMKPYPAEISQYERQLVRYVDNHYFSSPYNVQSQTTTVKLASDRIEKKSEQSPTTVKDDTITYGPYSDIAAYEFSEMTLHFENDSPFLTITSLVREIEISHYGNIAVEESYTVQHDGARLKGAFSRYDYQRSQGHAPAHIPGFRQILPIGASDIYYRDEIGNISTSHVSFTARGTTLDLIPRFPLFGGWKFGFYMGYNLPTEDCLFVDNQQSGVYMLNISFAPTFDHSTIDELTVRIILPEGASDIDIATPFPIDSKTTAHHYTYLDTSGRPVLVITKKNVNSEHNKPFQMTYKFSTISMLQEPFLLIVAFFSFFLLIMIYVRMEFHIGPVKQRKPNADRIDEILVRVKDFYDQRAEQHQALDDALNKSSAGKTQEYTSKRNKIEGSLSTLTGRVQKSIAEMEEVDTEVARKLKDLERKEDEKTASQLQLHDVELAQRSGKGVKDDSVKAKWERVYTAAEEEVETLVNEILGDL